MLKYEMRKCFQIYLRMLKKVFEKALLIILQLLKIKITQCSVYLEQFPF